MKKVFMTVVAMCFTATIFAANNQPTPAKWEGEINSYKLSQYLGLNSNQSEEVANICEYFAEQMKMVNNSKNSGKLLRNAVYGNLKLMKKTLTPEQYTKYAAVLNVTLQNRGIDLNGTDNK